MAMEIALSVGVFDFASNLCEIIQHVAHGQKSGDEQLEAVEPDVEDPILAWVPFLVFLVDILSVYF